MNRDNHIRHHTSLNGNYATTGREYRWRHRVHLLPDRWLKSLVAGQVGQQVEKISMLGGLETRCVALLVSQQMVQRPIFFSTARFLRLTVKIDQQPTKTANGWEEIPSVALPWMMAVRWVWQRGCVVVTFSRLSRRWWCGWTSALTQEIPTCFLSSPVATVMLLPTRLSPRKIIATCRIYASLNMYRLELQILKQI